MSALAVARALRVLLESGEVAWTAPYEGRAEETRLRELAQLAVALAALPEREGEEPKSSGATMTASGWDMPRQYPTFRELRALDTDWPRPTLSHAPGAVPELSAAGGLVADLEIAAVAASRGGYLRFSPAWALVAILVVAAGLAAARPWIESTLALSIPGFARIEQVSRPGPIATVSHPFEAGIASAMASVAQTEWLSEDALATW